MVQREAAGVVFEGVARSDEIERDSAGRVESAACWVWAWG